MESNVMLMMILMVESGFYDVHDDVDDANDDAEDEGVFDCYDLFLFLLVSLFRSDSCR